MILWCGRKGGDTLWMDCEEKIKKEKKIGYQYVLGAKSSAASIDLLN